MSDENLRIIIGQANWGDH